MAFKTYRDTLHVAKMVFNVNDTVFDRNSVCFNGRKGFVVQKVRTLVHTSWCRHEPFLMQPRVT